MASGRKKTCVCCGEQIEDYESFVPYKKRYAHERCFNIAVKAVHVDKQEKLEEKEKEKKQKTPPKTKPKGELKDGMSEEEYRKKKAFYDYLRGIIGDENMTAKVYAVSELYIDKKGFTFESMHKTLIYLKEILARNDLYGDVIGLIPYHHDEAQKYYAELEKLEKQNKDVDVGNMYHQRVIRIIPRKNNRRLQEIDIGSIGKEE